MMDLQGEFKVSQLLDCDEQIKLDESLLDQNPGFRQTFGLGHCLHKILIVADSTLNSGTTVSALSEFTVTYRELESENKSDL